MYVPVFNAWDDPAQIRALVTKVGAAELITVGADGYPLSTLLPVVWDGDRLLLHLARANPHWRSIGEDAPALAVVTGPQAYVSPAWYATKLEHGRVVPTWNYSAVQFVGRASVRTDPEWLLEAVSRLTETHETPRDAPWVVTDAPEDFIAKTLRAIVGVEFRIEKVEAKAKLSQNRSEADRAGVVAGLRHEGGPRGAVVADAMESLDGRH
jgi:transcriptional regulator